MWFGILAMKITIKNSFDVTIKFSIGDLNTCNIKSYATCLKSHSIHVDNSYMTGVGQICPTTDVKLLSSLLFDLVMWPNAGLFIALVSHKWSSLSKFVNCPTSRTNFKIVPNHVLFTPIVSLCILIYIRIQRRNIDFENNWSLKLKQ